MNNPPRELYRTSNDKMIGGVCGGLAQYLGLDSQVVRLAVVAITLFTGVPAILYVVAMLLLPERSSPR